MFTRTLLHRTALSTSGWLTEFNNPERAFEDAPGMGRPSTITTNQNIEPVERILMPDRQVSLRRLAYELVVPKTTVHEIIDNQFAMKKVCTWWLPTLVTPIQRQQSCGLLSRAPVRERSKSGQLFFDFILTGDESWIHQYDPLSQLEAKVWKKSDQQTPPTRLDQGRSAGKIIMIIFWDKRWCSTHRVSTT